MKVLFIVDGFRKGGKERRLIELLKGLSHKENIDISILSLRMDMSYESVEQLNIPIKFINKKWKNDLFLFIKILLYVKEIKPDIIHTWSVINTFYAIPSKIFSRAALINSQITTAPDKFNWFTKQGFLTWINFKFSDVICSNSYAGLKSFGVNQKGICINNGTSFKRFENLKPKAEVREFYDIKTRYVVGMVARICYLKDYPTYIKAANTILTKRDDITFLIIGDGPDMTDIAGRIPENNKNRIKIVGEVNNIEEIVNTFDIGVLTTFTEGISNSIMEYMALGKPVIATDGGGTNELIVDKETGFLIKPGDSGKLVEYIEKLLANDEYAEKLGENGKKRIQENFYLNKMVDDYYKQYLKYSSNSLI